MAQITEAACLIDQGAMFPNRQGFRDPSGKTVLIGFKPGACSIYFDDEPIYHFDLEGRWQRAFLGADTNNPETPKNLAGVPGTHYLKAFDTNTSRLVRLHERQEIKIHRHSLNFTETVQMDDHVRQMAMDLHEHIATGQLSAVNPPETGRTAGKPVSSQQILDFLERIAGWDTNRWIRQKEQFQSTFGPLPMTPPGLPGSLTLQATLGNSGDAGAGFGGSETTPLYLRDPEEFRNHLHAVLQMWGRRLPQARGIYLAGSDLILQPMSVILDFLDQIQEELSDCTIDMPEQVINPLRVIQKYEIHLATHHLDAPVPSVDLLHHAANRGLAHVTLGVESADPKIRNFYGRNWNNQHLENWLRVCEATGIKLSLIWLMGAGGEEYPDDLDSVTQMIQGLPIPPMTVLYFMDAAETASPEWKSKLGIRNSNAKTVYDIRERLLPLLKPSKIKVAHYSLEKEWQ